MEHTPEALREKLYALVENFSERMHDGFDPTVNSREAVLSLSIIVDKIVTVENHILSRNHPANQPKERS